VRRPFFVACAVDSAITSPECVSSPGREKTVQKLVPWSEPVKLNFKRPDAVGARRQDRWLRLMGTTGLDHGRRGRAHMEVFAFAARSFLSLFRWRVPEHVESRKKATSGRSAKAIPCKHFDVLGFFPARFPRCA